MRSWVKSWKQPLAEMQGKTAYIRHTVVEPFPGLCASGSYVDRAAIFYSIFSAWILFWIQQTMFTRTKLTQDMTKQHFIDKAYNLAIDHLQTVLLLMKYASRRVL
jgi:hypothetical protein